MKVPVRHTIDIGSVDDEMDEQIKLYHGDGGKYTNVLINELFYRYFDNEILLQGSDSAVFQTNEGRLAFTTDSFVVKPLFFSGGNIGKLAVCGTVNDLAVSGARRPLLRARARGNDTIFHQRSNIRRHDNSAP